MPNPFALVNLAAALSRTQNQPSTHAALASGSGSGDWSGPVLCTYQAYEEDKARLGAAADNAPGWCGIRYSALNAARIVAVNGLSDGLCAQCLEIKGNGPSVYVLAIDLKEAPGLDIAGTSFHNLFPDRNILDPETCNWRVVDPSLCSG
eukprot:jgi/Hompol1/4401/HPOL_007084-RA